MVLAVEGILLARLSCACRLRRSGKVGVCVGVVLVLISAVLRRVRLVVGVLFSLVRVPLRISMLALSGVGIFLARICLGRVSSGCGHLLRWWKNAARLERIPVIGIVTEATVTLLAGKVIRTRHCKAGATVGDKRSDVGSNGPHRTSGVPIATGFGLPNNKVLLLSCLLLLALNTPVAGEGDTANDDQCHDTGKGEYTNDGRCVLEETRGIRGSYNITGRRGVRDRTRVDGDAKGDRLPACGLYS